MLRLTLYEVVKEQKIFVPLFCADPISGRLHPGKESVDLSGLEPLTS